MLRILGCCSCAGVDERQINVGEEWSGCVGVAVRARVRMAVKCRVQAGRFSMREG